MAVVADAPQIDPTTGERIEVDPNTGERIGASAASTPTLSIGGHDLSTVAGMQPGMRARDPGTPIPPSLQTKMYLQSLQQERQSGVVGEAGRKLVDAAKAIPRGVVTGVATAIGADDPFTGEDARDELEQGIRSALAKPRRQMLDQNGMEAHTLSHWRAPLVGLSAARTDCRTGRSTLRHAYPDHSCWP